MKPTKEQQAIVDTAAAGEHLVIEAGAGTGKTSTLKLLAKAKPRQKGVYLAYNKAIATEAARSFPGTVECRTAHSFAYGSVGVQYKHRLNGPRLPARETAERLAIREPLRLGDDVPTLAPQQLARIVSATVDRFCQSADAEITRWHVPKQPGFEAPLAWKALGEAIAPWARKAWADIISKEGKLRFTHDCYLKIWQLSQPKLHADFVLLDEAQDSNPAVAAVVDGQAHAQRILVGDRCQAIYGWRGAVDAMANFDGTRLYLSQSFRFGHAVAVEANKWLGILDAQLRLKGYGEIPSRVEHLDEADAILCRSNGGALSQVFNQIAARRRVALVGGGDELRRFAEASIDLMGGRGTAHPELMAFRDWSEVQDYVQQDAAGSDIKVLVGLVDKHGPDAIITVTGQLAPENRADVVISTAHKAKGREWPRVRINDDFREPRPDPETGHARVREDEAMLAYVAVTRAQHVLDREGLAWVDAWVPGAQYLDDPAERIAGVAEVAPEYVVPVDEDPPARLDPPPSLMDRHRQTCLHGCLMCVDDVESIWPAPVAPGGGLR